MTISGSGNISMNGMEELTSDVLTRYQQDIENIVIDETVKDIDGIKNYFNTATTEQPL